MKKVLEDFDFFDKKVFVRVDFNVPMNDGVITDDLRIVEALQTIKYLLANNAKIILCSHLGRPKGTVNEKYSLKPVFERLTQLLPKVNIFFAQEFDFDKLREQTDKLNVGEILLLENIRFLSGEEKNDDELSKNLASLADIFVFDAFGTSHRKHSSTYGIAKYLPSCMGKLMQKELAIFDEVLSNPTRPLVAVLGGAKIGDKIALTENLLSKVNTLLIGGGMCFTFLKALKGDVGKSLVDDGQVDFCYNVIKKAIENKVRIVLPVDFVCAKSLDDISDITILKGSQLSGDYMGLDIGPKTVRLFSKYIKRARTLVWNGPMGAYEYDEFAMGTKMIAEKIAKNKKCKSVVGGGDVVSSIEKYNLQSGFYHISTGGGASLMLLEGKVLPCYEVLQDQESENNQWKNLFWL